MNKLNVNNDWIDSSVELPAAIEGKDYSENVWGWDGHSILIVSLFHDYDGFYWANCYGDVFGEAHLDDFYDIKYWQNIDIPNPPGIIGGDE